MPLMQCTIDGVDGWKYGDSGTCYPGEAGKSKAVEQGKAIEAHRRAYDVGSHKLDGVEIFAVGTHNGDSFTEADLDAMVEAFSQLDYKPPLKQGHVKDTPGMPALGYVESLQRVGKKLIASFSNIPTVVMEALKRRSYNTVSAEVYFNLNRGGKKFGKALKAVALLGADIPAVAGLAPLSSLFAEINSEIRIYDFDVSEEEDMSEDMKALQEKMKSYEERLTAATLEVELAKKAQATAEEDARATKARIDDINKGYEVLAKKDRENTIKGKTELCTIPAFRGALTGLYELALDAPESREFAIGDKKVTAVGLLDRLVADLNAKVKLFAEQGFTANGRDDGDAMEDPSAEVNRRVNQLLAEKKASSYSEAMTAVLAVDPELKARYAAVQN